MVARYPQYGYTPGRSHRDALRRVFDHCAMVRTRCRAQQSTLHDKFAGSTGKQLIGGIQVALDLAAALRRQLNNETPEGALRPDAFKRGPGSSAWQRVMSTLVDPPESSLTAVPDYASTGVPCPECMWCVLRRPHLYAVPHVQAA